jgi:hypothetical protein
MVHKDSFTSKILLFGKHKAFSQRLYTNRKRWIKHNANKLHAKHIYIYLIYNSEYKSRFTHNAKILAKYINLIYNSQYKSQIP